MAVIKMNENTFREMLELKETMLVEYWAPWCTYCRRLAPTFEKVSEEKAGFLTCGKVNVDDEKNLAAIEGIEVLPTLVLYQNGRSVASITAPESKSAIDDFLSNAFSR